MPKEIHGHLSALQRATLMRRATVAAVCVAVILILAKTYAWGIGGSVSMQATLMDSVLDVAASLINFFAVRHSLKPADREHRYGHGKIEALAGLGQSLFIMVSGLFILKSAVDRILHPQPLLHTGTGLGVVFLAILMTYLLVRYQKYVTEKTGSTAIAADATHYQSDLFINLSVFLSLLLSGMFHFLWVDAVMGSGIAVYVLLCSYKITRTSLDILMDRELPKEVRRTIKQAVLAHPDVHGLHDLRTRSTGSHYFFQLHLELDQNLTLDQAHHIAFEVEARIKKHYPEADIIIHQDVRRDQR